jgi:hypothetical protein
MASALSFSISRASTVDALALKGSFSRFRGGGAVAHLGQEDVIGFVLITAPKCL